MSEHNLGASKSDTKFSASDEQVNPIQPGGPLPDHMLWETSVDQNDPSIELGITTPDGDYFPFDHGESLIMIMMADGQRQPFVRLKSGQEVRFESWRLSRRQEFAEVLDNVDEDYKAAYLAALEDFPHLDQMQVELATSQQYPNLKYTGGFWRKPQSDADAPKIVVIMGQNGLYEQLLIDRELSARKSAEIIGIDFEVMKEHPNILKLFIFLHEIGHVEDYITNFRKKSELDGSDPVQAKREKRNREMVTLPIPGVSPDLARRMYDSGELQTYYAKYQQNYQRIRGLMSVEELLDANEIAYHELPSERYADQRAGEILRKHWNVLINHTK
ncbi:MAG: hypothetical protein WC227_04335 [Patescibacteria group bacterium]|jgi:hypothetical protein